MVTGSQNRPIIISDLHSFITSVLTDYKNHWECITKSSGIQIFETKKLALQDIITARV